MNYFQGLESPAGSPQPYRVLQTGLVCLYPRTDRQDRPSPAGYLCVSLPPSLPPVTTAPSLDLHFQGKQRREYFQHLVRTDQSVESVCHVTSSVGWSVKQSCVKVAASRDGTKGWVIPCSYRAIARYSALFSSVNRRDGGAHWAHCLHPDGGSEQSGGSWV